MRVADRWSVKPVAMKCTSSKRAVLESWAAENLMGERGNLRNLVHGASALNTYPAA